MAQRSEPDRFARMVACLNESNRRWAPSAPLLVLTVADRHFESDGRPLNRHFAYDLGLAVQNMTVQVTSMGLIVHQIAGILPDVARQTYQIPDAYEIMTMIAIGYQGTLEDLNPHYHEREQRPRTRKALSELIFADLWGRASALTVGDAGDDDT
jgi:nitroreductase